MPILVATDGGNNSENVVETGYDLANAYGVELYVIHILSESKFKSRSENSPEYYREDGREDAETVAARVVEDAIGPQEDIRTIGRVGAPADKVLGFADEINAGYIVTGGRRKSPVGKAVFGSDAQKILLNSTRPVVTVMGPTNAPE